MATDQTVVEHLLKGRKALELEVARLTAAINDIDSVIALFDNGSAGSSRGATDRPVAAATRSPRKSTRRTATRRTTRTTTTDSGKSIRVHVLDLLGSEDRDFGLTEIIDRIRGLGIQAHDDAVRSITIKLMKDGQVERVGRGQYRLVGSNRSAASTATHTPPVAAPADNETTGQFVPPLDFDQEPTY